MWFSVISGCFLGSKRGRLRAHALRRGGLSASVPTLTRRLLGLTFIYYPTPRAAPLRGLPWAIVLSPRLAGLINSAPDGARVAELSCGDRPRFKARAQAVA